MITREEIRQSFKDWGVPDGVFNKDYLCIDDLIELCRDCIALENETIRNNKKRNYEYRIEDIQNSRDAIKMHMQQIIRLTKHKNEERMISKGTRLKAPNDGTYLVVKAYIGTDGLATGYSVKDEQTGLERYRSRVGLEQAINDNKIKLL